MSEQEPRLAYYVGDNDQHAKNWLASLWEYLTKRAKASGEARHLAAQELVRVAWKVLDGSVDPQTALKTVRGTWPEAVTYPRTKREEFVLLGDVVDHLLGSTVDQDRGRARAMSRHVACAIHRRIAVSMWLRQFAPSDYATKLEDSEKAIQRVLEGYDESDWPSLRARVIRAALRAVGADEARFKNDDFEFERDSADE